MAKCFYHLDLDGCCAGFWVRHYFESENKGELKLIPINYNITFPMDTIQKDEEVWIVDFSIKPEEMKELLGITKNVHWIDHHKTNLEKYKDFPETIEGIRYDDSIAGCTLTWAYTNWLVTGVRKNVEEMIPPLFTALISDYDTWSWQYGETKFFILGMETYNTEPENDIWDTLLDEEDGRNWGMDNAFRLIMADGKAVDAYKTKWAAAYAKAWGYPVEFEGHKCFVCNISPQHGGDSIFFGKYLDEYDIVLPFVQDHKGNYTISLYSNSVDVSVIATKYGKSYGITGGGHKFAAGFVAPELPWNPVKEILHDHFWEKGKPWVIEKKEI